MSKDRLLSDEELLWHIRKTKEPHYACEFKQDNTYRKTVKCGGCLHSSESARNAENALLDLINTQKRLYAESVIGEYEGTFDKSQEQSASSNYWRNQLREEQRARIR